jgi:hypothetical protein
MIDFPSSPTVGQIFNSGTLSFKWNGVSWVPVPGGGGGIPDAPSDGIQYGRQNASWTEITGGGGGGSFLPLSGGTLTGFLTLNDDPTAILHAATKQYVDQEVADVVIATATDYILKAGGTMTGSLILAADPVVPLEAATKAYVDAQVAAALTATAFQMDSNGDAIIKFGAAIVVRIKPTGLILTKDDVEVFSISV